MIAEGAAIVDVGGESTRPGSGGVPLDEELRRVVPVLERLEGVPVSIDTAKSEVARRALELGAELVNDVTALRGDPELAGVVADARRVSLPDAHAGRAADDAGRPALRRRRDRGGCVPRAAAVGRRRRRDPGGACLPRPGHRLRQDAGAELRAACGGSTCCSRSAGPVLSGSRARARSGRLFDPEARTGTLAASLGAAVAAYERGASIFRVHDVREHVEALAGGGGDRMPIELTRDRAPRLPRRARVASASDGQHFLFDVELEVGEAGSSDDDIEDAVDYRDVAACVREVSDGARLPPARGARGRGRRRADRAASRLERVSRPRAQARRRARSAGRVRRRRADATVTRAYVGLGANLGDREATIRAALAALPGVVGVSTLRETDPVGVTDQPRFLNGVAALETELAPRELLDVAARGRARARARARRALGAAHDRPRPAPLRRRDDRRAGPDGPAPAPARAPVRARAARSTSTPKLVDSGPRRGGRRCSQG